MGEVIAFRSIRSSRADRETRDDGRAGAPRTRPEPAAIRSAETRSPTTSSGAGPEPLWREVAGSVLRDERRRQRRTLAQVAERAGMSVQYLSELERGRKEASSEMLGAACGSLGLGLGEFAARCARAITSAAARPSGPVLLAA